MTRERFDYIDIAKGIGILMVVWAHIMIVGWTHRVIYAFHMPLFFFLSGMLFQRDKYPSFEKFVSKRTKRLLIPYVIYSIVTWAFWAIFKYIRHEEVDSYMMPLLQTVISQGSGAFMVHNSALWFVPCLFLVEILYFHLCKLGKWWCLLGCFGCSFLSFFLGRTYGESWWFSPPWNADAALIALPFYGVGNVLAKEVGHSRLTSTAKEHLGICFIIFTLLTIPLFWSAMNYGECSMGSSSYQCQGWVFITRAFLGCSWIICLSLLIGAVDVSNGFFSAPNNYLKWAGINSLDIMCLHIPIKGVCMIGVAMLIHITVNDVGSSIFFSFISFILTMLIVWLVIKLFPLSKIIQKYPF